MVNDANSLTNIAREKVRKYDIQHLAKVKRYGVVYFNLSRLPGNKIRLENSHGGRHVQ